MNSPAVELSNTLTPRQKSLIRDLLNICMDNADLSYVELEPIFEALQHSSVYKSNIDLATANSFINRWMDEGQMG